MLSTGFAAFGENVDIYTVKLHKNTYRARLADNKKGEYITQKILDNCNVLVYIIYGHKNP